MREVSPDVETSPVLGTIYHIKRKTGQIASVIPCNAERVTIGRGYECDIRLYFEDVSKLHAAIEFDLDSGVASLVVHGNHGLLHTAASSKPSKYLPPAIITLADGDTFQVRKKMFRFEYGDPVPSGYASPAKTTNTDAVASPMRPRLSHRLSIVPNGKRFMPSPAKHATPRQTPGKSGLSNEVAPDEEEEEEDGPLMFDELVDVAEGDEGDKVYLEKVDDSEPIFKHPFMTPQPKRRLEPPNTSAVPRTRILRFDTEAVDEPADPESVEEDGADDDEHEPADQDEDDVEEAESDEEVVVPIQGPHTPHTPHVPSPLRSVMRPNSTPRTTSDSLRRALLVRSARKAWEQSQPEGIDREIANGHVVVRRRRSSSSRRSASSSPREAAPVSDSDSSDDAASSDDDKENAPQLQWVYENGRGELSHLDHLDDDTEASFDMDLSIPGQGILTFDAPCATPSDSDEYDDDDDDDDDDVDDDEEEEEEVEEDDEEEEEVEEEYEGSDDNDELSLPECEEVPLAADISSDIDDEVDQSQVVSPQDLSHSPTPSPVLAGRFYTPQPPKRNDFGPARMSLAGIGGPAVRFHAEETPVSPFLTTGMRIPATPSRLGKPVRLQYPTPAAKEAAEKLEGEDDREEEEKDEDEVPESPLATTAPAIAPAGPPATPFKTPVKGAGLTQEQREALATPLALPAAPASGFRDVQRPMTTPRRNTYHDDEDAPRTPYTDIKRRLGGLRQNLQSSAKKLGGERRASVAFADTPTRDTSAPAHTSGLTRSSSFTLGSMRRRGMQPTPRVDPIDEGDSESMPATPTNKLVAAAVEDKTPQDLVTASEARHARRRSLPSPSFAGLREMLKSPKVPKTPSVAGVRELFKTPKSRESSKSPEPQTPAYDGVRHLLAEPKHARTPSFAGVRDLFRQPQPVPPTPAMSGMREMLAQPAVPPTPDLQGVAELYPEPVRREESIGDEDTKEDRQDNEEAESRPEEADSDTLAESAPVDEAKEKEAPTKPAASAKSRLPTRASTRTTASTSSTSNSRTSAESAPVTRTRTRAKAGSTTESKSEPAPRTRAKASEEAPAPRVTRARSRTAEPEERPAAAPAPAPAPAPARRSRRVLGDAEEQAAPARKGKGKTAAAAPAAEDKPASTRSRTADKENSATPDPDTAPPRTRTRKEAPATRKDTTTLPVRVTRSRKA